MAKYRIAKNNVSKSPAFGKYFARRAPQGLVTFDELCKLMASRSTTFSEGEMHGLLIDMVQLVREQAYMGKSVKIDNLGVFWVAPRSGCQEKADDVTGNKIQSVWKCRPTGDGSGKALEVTRAGGISLTWEEIDNYESPRKSAASGNKGN